MTKQELCEQVWNELGPIRQRVVGRRKFDRLFDRAIERAPLVHLRCFSSERARDVLPRQWVSQVTGTDNIAFGPLFWILISPVIQFIVARLIDWWFDDPKNMAAMEGWRNV